MRRVKLFANRHQQHVQSAALGNHPLKKITYYKNKNDTYKDPCLHQSVLLANEASDMCCPELPTCWWWRRGAQMAIQHQSAIICGGEFDATNCIILA